MQLPPHKLKTDAADGIAPSTWWTDSSNSILTFALLSLSSQVRKSAVDICTLTQMDISKAYDRKALKPLKAVAIILSKDRTVTLSMIALLFHDIETGFGGADAIIVREIK